MTPKQLPSGKWRVQGYYKDPVTGKVLRPSFTAASKDEAKLMVAEFQVLHRNRKSNFEMTVGECLDAYIAAKENVLSPSTIRSYLSVRRNDMGRIENIKVSRLSDMDVQNFISDLSRSLAPKTVRNVSGLMFPALKMFGFDYFKVTLPTKVPYEYDIPTNAQVKQLIDLAKPDLKMAIILGSFGALREGEVSALFYSDVDYDSQGIKIHADMVKNKNNQWVIKDMPKTSTSIRFIPLPEKVMNLIGTGNTDAFVCPMNPAQIGNQFFRLKKKIGIKCRFHDLRKYYASIAAVLIPDIYAESFGGWRHGSRVMKEVYQQKIDPLEQQYADTMRQHFSGLISENMTQNMT